LTDQAESTYTADIVNLDLGEDSMHKVLILLGLLLHGPRHGYELHRIVRAHGDLYTDLKKGNLYYLLDRLAREGDLSEQAEPVARGARGERLIYALTDQGRAHFTALLRAVLRTYEPAHMGVEVAAIYLPHLPPAEAIALLEERQRAVAARREGAATELGEIAGRDPAARIAAGALAADHLLSLMDAELAWTDRVLAHLRASAATTAAPDDAQSGAGEVGMAAQHGDRVRHVGG
jgi:DNA-binding PadR family transcriptional regulator